MDNNFSKEEQELLADFHEGKLTRVQNFEEELQIAKNAAHNYLTKKARINIRLHSEDLNKIKAIALLECLPYQTLISSILHKCAAGYQQERKS